MVEQIADLLKDIRKPSIHFNFILSENDAENLIDIINDEKRRCLELRIEALSQKKMAEAKWFLKRSKYINSLKKKMKNTRCAHGASRKR